MPQEWKDPRIDRLADFIIEHVPGEPTDLTEHPVDTAIRIIRTKVLDEPEPEGVRNMRELLDDRIARLQADADRLDEIERVIGSGNETEIMALAARDPLVHALITIGRNLEHHGDIGEAPDVSAATGTTEAVMHQGDEFMRGLGTGMTPVDVDPVDISHATDHLHKDDHGIVHPLP